MIENCKTCGRWLGGWTGAEDPAEADYKARHLRCRCVPPEVIKAQVGGYLLLLPPGVDDVVKIWRGLPE